ncbi:MAG: rRNA maturation RNase YbeY [Chloroflexi bacterium]|nr:rRNA maturation RNase YbeY [Chloroflexota bacterium]
MTDATRRTIYLRPWRIDIVRLPGVASPLPASLIARATVAALEAAAAPEPGSVTVVLADDEELADLNLEHMGHEGPTDVLSFPMLEPGAFRGRGTRVVKRIHIGDIAISVERAIEQAVEGRGGHTGDVRWSPADEMRLLVTHGTLHLCGRDHEEPADEVAMRALERDLLAVKAT